MGRLVGDGKIGIVEEGTIGDGLAKGPVLVHE